MPDVLTFAVEIDWSDPAPTVSYNCECDDDYPRKTLAQMRAFLATRLGYAAQLARLPPGMSALLDSFLVDAQEQIYRQYKVFRMERIFTWDMEPGVRFYDLLDNILAQGIVAPAGVSATPGAAGSMPLGTYWYQVSALNSLGETLASTETSATTTAVMAPPAAPTLGYTNGMGILPGGDYRYQITAINDNGETLPSSEASITVPGGALSINTVTLNWTAVTGATGYKIYGRSFGLLKLIATVGAVTTYNDTGYLAPFGDLPTTNTAGVGSVTVDWSAVDGATGYRVYGRTQGVEQLIATVGAVTTYLDDGSVTPSGFPATSNTTSICPKHLDPRKVTWVGISDGDNFWRKLVCGIKPEYYYADVTGFPTHYEIRQCIEVWPAPEGSTYKLRIKGYFELARLEQDNDYNSVDYEAIQLYALANAKAHYGQPDAANYMQQYRAYVAAVTAGSHHTRRYVPDTEEWVAPSLPVFTGYSGD
ncbi:MAG: phage adaptor protein [Rhodanobacter sp.]